MEQLEIEIKRNEDLKKLIELAKENDKLEKDYELMIFKRHHKRVQELLEKRKERKKL